jgi:hypothetical protein
MSDPASRPTRPTTAPTVGPDRIDLLLSRTAGGDRATATCATRRPLGGGDATVRTVPGVFVGVDDLGAAVVTVAAAANPARAAGPRPRAALRSAIHLMTVRRR